jgi:DNA-binding NarL/FixJ family response regulator
MTTSFFSPSSAPPAPPTAFVLGEPTEEAARPPLPIRLPVAAVYAEGAIARAGLAALLRAEMIEVALPEEEGLDHLRSRPDVILLAGFAPEPELAARAARRHDARVILMGDNPLDGGAIDTLGVHAAVCRECPPERLIDSIHAVAGGDTYFECHTHPAAPTPKDALLSPRERRVAAELARGSGIEEIASLLCISPHTARTHVRNIRRKLNARTSAEAVARAITLGLVALPAR